MNAQSPSVDTPQAEMTPARTIKADIDAYERDYKHWLDRGDAILARYRDERLEPSNQTYVQRKFNILWSNVETLKPTLYARLPKLAVERRFKDKDPVGRTACEIAERMGDYILQTSAANEVFKQCVLDRLLPGRAVTWITYKAEYDEGEDKPEQITDQDDGRKVTNEDGSPKEETPLEKVQEKIQLEYVDFKDFGHSPVRTWEEVKRLWRKKYFTQEQLKKRFPKQWQDIPLDRKLKDTKEHSEEIIPQATIYEVYDSTDRKVRWVHVGLPEDQCILDEDDPAVEIEGFWPTPKPLYATLSNKTLIPVPDFIFYQDQANELDQVTNRIARLTDALKITGVYDASVSELARVLQPNGTPENQLIPVDSWAAFAEKGGVQGAISLVPLDQIQATLAALIQAREQIIQVIYQVTGLADIIRGATNPNETATAQQIKGQFASLRIRDTQAETARFCRDAARLVIECGVQLFEPKTIWDMTQAQSFIQPSQEDQMMAAAAQSMGMQPPQFPKMFMDAIALLRDDRMRSFHIDIETDSTIALDETQDKQDANEFITAMGGFIQQAGQVMQSPFGAEMAPLIGEMMTFVARRYKAGRTLEGTIEETVASIQKKMQQMAANPPPNPEMEKVKAKAQADQADRQLEAANDAAKQQREAANDQQDQQREAGKAVFQGRVEAAKALSKVAPIEGAKALGNLAGHDVDPRGVVIPMREPANG